MANKLVNRLLIIPIALTRSIFRKSYNDKKSFDRILIAHNLLLGDTILLAPLLAKLRALHKHAEIFLTVSPNLVSLYKMMPFGVHAIPYHPRHPSLLFSCIMNGKYDVAFIPGDNRYSWLARALGARTIVTLRGDGTKWKDWQSDHFIDWPSYKSPLADIFSSLAPGKNIQHFKTDDWILDNPITFNQPRGPYYILHISSRNPNRRWPSKKWRGLANIIKNNNNNIKIIWSTGPNEEHLLNNINPTSDEITYTGTLDLLQITHLIKNSELLITVETGIAHLCRITGTKSIVIFGQGNPAIHGTEQYWENESPQIQIFNKDIPCRDIHTLFGREIPWVFRCDRNINQCENPFCITSINPEKVYNATINLKQSYKAK